MHNFIPHYFFPKIFLLCILVAVLFFLSLFQASFYKPQVLSALELIPPKNTYCHMHYNILKENNNNKGWVNHYPEVQVKEDKNRNFSL